MSMESGDEPHLDRKPSSTAHDTLREEVASAHDRTSHLLQKMIDRSPAHTPILRLSFLPFPSSPSANQKMTPNHRSTINKRMSTIISGRVLSEPRTQLITSSFFQSDFSRLGLWRKSNVSWNINWPTADEGIAQGIQDTRITDGNTVCPGCPVHVTGGAWSGGCSHQSWACAVMSGKGQRVRQVTDAGNKW